ncbi:hypothetical protein ScPMuIL_005403 [Solemya velum]
MSPNYPGSYPNNTHCVWNIEASSNYRINLTIESFGGQLLDGTCADFLQINDGSAGWETLMNKTCTPLNNYSVLSTARWLKVSFKSDGHIAGNGLRASIVRVYTGSVINNYSSPIAECRSYQFECGNRECLTRAYLCDGFNDCGCVGDCDEDDCHGAGLDQLAAIGMGISIGFAIFIVIFTVTFALEQNLKKRAVKRNIKKHMEKSGGANDPFLKPPDANTVNRY